MLLQWKADDDDDADFSFEPSGNSFSQVMDYKPVVVPEWKERNIEFWDKNIALSETDGAASMQVWLRVDGRGQVEPSKRGDVMNLHRIIPVLGEQIYCCFV